MTRGGADARWAWLVTILILGCGDSAEGETEPTPADAGSDAGACPEYRPDGGVVQLMRDCPLSIEYGIR